ncbi:50S ribosomal protein L32 [Candidatus Peregrinibacteria bacterium]|nr:50S ribosomal protein L32 [Candidatus Peregrinibacteria bacterium]
MGKRPVQKKKAPRSQTKKRYSAFKKRAQKILYEKYVLVACANCGEMKLSHHICPNCGHYGKRRAIDTGKDVVKKIKA